MKPSGPQGELTFSDHTTAEESSLDAQGIELHIDEDPVFEGEDEERRIHLEE